MYEARYWGILSAYTILNVQAGFIHVICLGISNRAHIIIWVHINVGCLGISNKSVAVPRQDSIRPYRAHAVLSRHCNIIIIILPAIMV